MMMIKKMKIIISGGGTAGHIYPALSVADELKGRGAEILFVGAQGRMEMTRVPMNGYQIVGLPVAGIQRRMTLGNLAVPFKLMKSLAMARSVLRDFMPDVVVGFGGYASAPVLFAAQSMGIPTVIQEQNSFAGLTNKILARRAKKVCVAYRGMERFFAPSKIVLTGNPLRGSFSDLTAKKAEASAHFGFSADRPTILVTGGSLGTRTLNDMMVRALDSLPADVQVIWQTGKFYEKSLESVVVPSRVVKVAFIERMDLAYAISDLVICRAGASTVSELELLGMPAVFVPSPNVAEDHQTQNARSLVDLSAALMVADSRALEEAMPLALELLSKPARLSAMADAIAKLGRPEAAVDVADIVVGVV